VSKIDYKTETKCLQLTRNIKENLVRKYVKCIKNTYNIFEKKCKNYSKLNVERRP